MIALNQFMEGINLNVDRVKEYRLGHSGKNGYCDCIGLIIGALQLMGQSWNGTHGTNYAKRYKIQDGTFEQNTLANLYVGKVLFKGRTEQDSGYSLPDKYKNGPDLIDYYHVGVCTSVSPLQITHCTSVPGGIQRDTKLGKWKYGGQIDGVDYNKEVPIVFETAYVTGGSLNLRSTPSTSSVKIASIPDGSKVQILQKTNQDWNKIVYDGKTGYVMSKFLSSSVSSTINIDRSEAERWYEVLRVALNK